MTLIHAEKLILALIKLEILLIYTNGWHFKFYYISDNSYLNIHFY